MILAALALFLAGVVTSALWIGGVRPGDEGVDFEPDVVVGVAVDAPNANRLDGEVAELFEPFESVGELQPASRSAAFEEGTAAVVAQAGSASASDAVVSEPGIAASGRLVDAATGEPLPEYTFELLVPGGKPISVTTDAQGAFVTSAALRPGPLRARFTEASRAWRTIDELRLGEDGTPEPLALRVESGPTYRIVLSPPTTVPVEEYAPRIESRTSEGWKRAPGRIGGITSPAGGVPWVRFGPIPMDSDSETRLVFDSRDGVWRGRADVQPGLGIHGGVVTIPMKAFASIHVTVRNPEGNALEDALVEWVVEGAERPNRSTTRDDGESKFERIASEVGTLRVRKVRFIDQDIVMTPAIGERTELDVVLTPAPSAGSISGTVLSDSGTYSRDVTIHLLPRGNGREALRQISVPVNWTGTAGARVGRFQFDDLPVGTWRISVAEFDWYEWEPRAMEVEAPLSGVEFRVHDGVLVADLVFEAVDPEGREVRDFQVRLVSNSDALTERSRGGRVLIPSFPVDRMMRWRLDTNGLASSYGDWSSMSPLTAVEGRDRRGARPVLEPGAAQLFRVVRSDNRRAIEDAVAIVGGREVGRTNASGHIVLRSDQPSAKVEFRHKGWRMLDSAALSPVVRRNTPFVQTIRLQVPKKKTSRKR